MEQMLQALGFSYAGTGLYVMDFPREDMSLYMVNDGTGVWTASLDYDNDDLDIALYASHEVAVMQRLLEYQMERAA